MLNYKGLSGSEVDELLAQQVQRVLDERQQAAQQLLRRAEAFLQRQAAQWQLAVQVLATWLSSLVGLYESHRASSTAAEAGIKAALRSSVQQFEQEDAAREAALDAAVQLLSQSSDDRELEARLQAALQALAAIQVGYREHHAYAVAAVRAYPGQVKDRHALYTKCLYGLLHVQPQPQTEGTTRAAACGPRAASCAGSNVGDVQASAGGSVMALMCSQADAGSPQSPHIQLQSGAVYDCVDELWQSLLEATPKPWLAHLQPLLLQKQGSTAGALEGPSPAPAAPVKVAAAGKPTKQQLAEAAAVEEAARAAAEAAAAAAEAAAAQYAAAVAPPPCPACSSGAPLCLDLPTPDAAIAEGLQQLQARVIKILLSTSFWKEQLACGSADTTGRDCLHYSSQFRAGSACGCDTGH